jgi:O-acetyl-ADP-ribose deacetylase (regulator of RNase III)
MVRILVRESGRTVPMGFVPGEAEETAEELRAAAVRAGAAGGREVARPAITYRVFRTFGCRRLLAEKIWCKEQADGRAERGQEHGRGDPDR